MTIPSKERPIVLLGAGVLGRRIAAVFLAGGYNVHIRDPNKQALSDAESFIHAQLSSFTAILPQQGETSPGSLNTFIEIAPAVQNAWLVVEAVPEKLELKRTTFVEVVASAPADCVLASNSSSFKSRFMVEGLVKERREMALNMHFTMPPAIRTVELMTDGETKEELFGMLSEVLRECGMVPVTARRESTGFVFNRLWAAVKREILTILAEDVSTPEEIDLLWENMFQLPTSKPPCRLMDQIGLDTVAFIEDNYIQERGLEGKQTVDWLRKNYIQQERLGLKSWNGGLYSAGKGNKEAGETIYVLDVGLGANNPDISAIPTAGRILKLTPSTNSVETLVSGQSLPDGIDISQRTSRMFWTNMGRATSTYDGSVHSANLDGSDVQTIIASGAVHTPKQLVVDNTNQHVYFCDREGMGVHRCNYDGSDHRVLVQTGSLSDPNEKGDMTRWCVGITIDPTRGYIYWTQKGPSKSGQGRIFRANVNIPDGQAAANRSDIELLLENLPEPIDLELDQENQVLYWTDRGEHPIGCSLNRISVAGDKFRPEGKEIMARQFHEPIGLKLNANKEVIVADLGGSVYRIGQGKTVIMHDQGSYTGVCLCS